MRGGVVPDILGALEHSEGQAGKKVAGGEQTRSGTQTEPGGP